MSPVSPKSTESSVKEGEDERYEQMRVEAFDLVWSKVETAIKVCTLISCNFLSLVLCSTRILCADFGYPFLGEGVESGSPLHWILILFLLW